MRIESPTDLIKGIWAYNAIKKLYVNGIDVTSKCFGFDTRKREVYCYKRDASGKFYLENGEVAKETIVGKITIDWGGSDD